MFPGKLWRLHKDERRDKPLRSPAYLKLQRAIAVLGLWGCSLFFVLYLSEFHKIIISKKYKGRDVTQEVSGITSDIINIIVEMRNPRNNY